MIMNQQIWNKGFLQIGILCIGIPVLLYIIGDVPKRTLLKESLSLVTLLAFFLMIAQFFLTRCNRRMLHGCLMVDIIKLHKVVGYFFVVVLLVHPFLIVLPRFFEAGVDPKDALLTILTTVQSVGVVTGMGAWVLMLLLGITALFRKRLFAQYTTWRTVHGILAVLLLICGAWHAIDLGRHMTSMLSVYCIGGVLSGISLLVKMYISTRKVKVLQEVTI